MDKFFAGSREALCFPSDDILLAEGCAIILKMRGYDPSHVDQGALVQLAKDWRTGDVVSGAQFLRSLNCQRRTARRPS